MIDIDQMDGEKESSASEQKSGPQEYSTKNPVLIINGCADVGRLLLLEQARRNCRAENENGTECKTAFFTFQNTLVSAAEQQLEMEKTQNRNLLISTVHACLQKIYGVLVKNGTVQPRRFPNQQLNGKNDKNDRLMMIRQILCAHREKFGKHHLQELTPDFWLEEFLWMKQMNVWTGEAESYLLLSRKNRGSSVFMSRMDRIVAYQLFEMYCHELETRGETDWEDVPLLVIRNAAAIPKREKFDCVLVDEAQDLSLAEFTALSMLYEKDMMAVLDKRQRIYERIWKLEQLQIDWTSRPLIQPPRTTRQIAALAESVCQNGMSAGMPDKAQPVLPQREGSVPCLVHLKDRMAEQRYLINLVKEYQKRNPNLTIGIITAGKQQADLCGSWLSSEGVEHERLQKDASYCVKTAGIKVLTAFAAKGLEFHCVILPMFEEGNYPLPFAGGDEEKRRQFELRMRNLLYVAMTRARTLLTITWSGANGSRFLQEMDPALYRLEGLPTDLSGFSEMENNIERRSDLRLKTMGGTAAAVDWSRESTREVSGNAGQQTMDSGRKVRVGFVQYHSQSKPNSVQIQDTCMHTETYVRQRQENRPQERAARGRISTGHGKAPYCQENGSQEAAQIRSMEAVQWLEAISGAEKGKYAGIQAGDALRRVVSGYGVWCKARDSVFESGTREDREWMALIWPQFITSVTEQHLELFEMDPGKKTQYLSVFLEKVFHLSFAISAAEHAQRMQEERYRRYFAESFYPDRQADIWRWLGGRQAANNSVVVLNRFLDCQMHLSIWLSMCLFFMVQPQTDEWMKRETENRNRIGLLKVQIEKEGRTDAFLLKVLAAGTLSDEFCGKLWKLADQLEAAGAVLGECEESRPNEKAEKSRPDDKAEKRAETANRGNADAENPQLCLQGEVLQLRQLVKNNVPELLHLLLEYQKYQKSETGIGGSVLYQKESGVLNRRISDLLENLGITMEESIYQIRRKQERILHAQIDTISETMHSDEILQQPFTRQELAERADVESSIASFEAILDGTLPQVMREAVNRVIYDLKSFDRLTDILPDEKKKLRRFLRIYVPEVVEMLVSYQQYRRGGFDQESMDGLKTKIQNALDSLDAALKEKQRMIGNMETMRTAAQAETVDELLNSEV